MCVEAYWLLRMSSYGSRALEIGSDLFVVHVVVALVPDEHSLLLENCSVGFSTFLYTAWL